MSLPLRKISINFVLIVWVAVCVFPMIIMIFGSFKTEGELASNPLGLPASFDFHNYIALFSYSGGLILRTFFNGLFITLFYTSLTVFISAMAAYAFSKYRFKGRNIIFFALLITMMIPYQLEIPSLFIFFSQIGWLNSYEVQIFPGIASVFTMFLIRQFMLSIPDSIMEAARIDGAGHWRTFLSIIVPVSSPVLGAMFILTALGKWNDYLWPLVMVNDPNKLPIMVILPTLNSSSVQFFVPWHLVLAGCVIVTIPLIVIFLLFQDKFMSSVTVGAVKD